MLCAWICGSGGSGVVGKSLGISFFHHFHHYTSKICLLIMFSSTEEQSAIAFESRKMESRLCFHFFFAFSPFHQFNFWCNLQSISLSPSLVDSEKILFSCLAYLRICMEVKKHFFSSRWGSQCVEVSKRNSWASLFFFAVVSPKSKQHTKWKWIQNMAFVGGVWYCHVAFCLVNLCVCVYFFHLLVVVVVVVVRSFLLSYVQLFTEAIRIAKYDWKWQLSDSQTK